MVEKSGSTFGKGKWGTSVIIVRVMLSNLPLLASGIAYFEAVPHTVSISEQKLAEIHQSAE
jgi:hypothetical protein